MNTKTPITIAKKEYTIGFSFRAIDLFEKMTGKSIQEADGTLDNVRYCYCSLKALNPEFEYTIDQFIDLLDAEPQLLIDMQSATADVEPQDRAANETTPKKKGLTKTFFALWMLSCLLLLSPVLIPVIFGSIWIFASWKLLYRRIAKLGNKPASS